MGKTEAFGGLGRGPGQHPGLFLYLPKTEEVVPDRIWVSVTE